MLFLQDDLKIQPVYKPGPDVDTREEEESLAAQEEEAAEEEEELANELIAEQEISAAEGDLQKLSEAGRSFGHPSYIKYGILFALAGSQDIIDLFDLTGIGAVVAFIYSLISGLLIIFICYITRTKLKRAHTYVRELEESFLRIQDRINNAVRLTVKVARIGGKSKTLRPIVRRGLRIINKSKGFIKRNPLLKVIVGNIADFIPALGLLPLATLSIYLSYRDEKKTYKEARDLSNDVFTQT